MPETLSKITDADFASFAPHALMAFAARCGRRARDWYSLSGYDPECRDHERALDAAIHLAEQVAAGHSPDDTEVTELGSAIDAAAKFALSPFEEAQLRSKAALSNEAAARAVGAIITVLEQWNVRGHQQLLSAAVDMVADLGRAYSLRFGYAYVRDNDPMLGYDGPSIHFADTGPLWDDLHRDLDLLREASFDSPSGLIPSHFFATRTIFEDRPFLVTIVTSLESRLIEACRNRPSMLYTLTPRQFETVVAELLTMFELEVELTARTRDGGRDIIAVRHAGRDIATAKYLIECKRYKADHPVGVEIVRALHGVTRDEHATKGIIVTTSHFTAPASTFIERNQWTLEGRDFDGLLDWLTLYENARLRRASTWMHSR